MTADIEVPAGVTVVRIDQGHVRNAINSETAQRLHDAFLAFDDDPDARVAVLTGDETAFCAGANLRDLPKLRDSGPLGPTRLQLGKPVIAAIEGWCVAGGVELAAWCDLRVAGRSARIGCLERRWGVPLIDGGTYRLPQIVGLGRALDLILTGREIGADEAERMGFVNRVVPDGEALPAAVALAAEIASYPWLAVVNDRKSVYAGLGRERADALATEDDLGKDTIFADGFQAGVERFNDHQASRDR
jgi:enoyl-CoA hydratase